MSIDLAGTLLRPEIAQSWVRASVCGLNPSSEHSGQVHPVDSHSRLARSAVPIITRLCRQLGNARVAFMLTDRSASLIFTGHSDTRLGRAMDSFGAVPGSIWSEETTGTNALATPYETREPIFIHGPEHFIDAMKDYSCYGEPIFNRTTGRLAGVLDIVTFASDENPLMITTLAAAVREIEVALVGTYGSSSRELLATFESESNASRHPIIAFGPDIVLQEARTALLLSAADVEGLRVLSEATTPGRGSRTETVTLHNGLDVEAGIRALSNAAGAVVTLRILDRAPIPRNPDRLNPFEQADEAIIAVRAQPHASVAIIGEPGSGRTAAAHRIGAGEQPRVLALLQTPPAVAHAALREHALDGGTTTLIVESAESLNPAARELLIEAARNPYRRLIAIWGADYPEEAAGIVGRFPHRLDLQPLRDMRQDLFGVIRAIRPVGARWQFDGPASRAMTAYSWPGNLTELAVVLDSLVPVADTRVITVSDLPAPLRKQPTKALTPWQKANRHAILDALDANRGNKSHAADYLGISRSSLYHHMRELGLT